MNLKKLILSTLLLLTAMLCGCAQTTVTKNTIPEASVVTPEDDLTPASDESNDIKDDTSILESSKNDISTSTAPINMEETKFTEITEASVFHVNWITTEGEYTSGTSSCIQTDFSEKPILITAFHYFWPEDAESFTGSDMKDYVLGGELFDMVTEDELEASIKEVITIKDAAPIPDIKHDLSAFYINGNENINPLRLANEIPTGGDTVYLLANLWDTTIPEEDCIYEAEVIAVEDGVLYYELGTEYGTTGASGAPIVNNAGEVVGIHIGSSGSIRAALSKEVIYDTLKEAIAN